MKTGSLNNWLKAFEQEIIEVAERIEATRKKLFQSSKHEANHSETLNSIANSLQREVVNLRQLGQRINFKNIQLTKSEGSGEP